VTRDRVSLLDRLRRSALLARLFTAFEVHAFRWLWSSQFLYVISLVMSRLALGWLVLDITNSALWVGIATGVEGAGKIIWGFAAGVLVDRLDKRALLVIGQLIFGVVGLIMGTLILFHQVALWNVLIVAFLLGAADTTLVPAANAITYQVVGRERVMNASAVNMIGFNLARTLGAALAGILIARSGLGACYLALGGLACLGALPMFGIRGNFHSTTLHAPFWRALRAGLRYAWHDGALRRMLGLSMIVEAFGFSHYTMISVIARDVLKVGAEGYGYLSSAGGIGASLGTLALASLGDVKQKGRLMWAVTTSAGVGIILFALSHSYSLSLLVALINGAMLASYDALMQAMVQLLTPDAMRGRVLSLYVLTFGFTSVGGTVAGLIASAAGAPVAISLGGGVIVAYLLWITNTMGHLRPVAESVPPTD
jgi:MFS family permease